MESSDEHQMTRVLRAFADMPGMELTVLCRGALITGTSCDSRVFWHEVAARCRKSGAWAMADALDKLAEGWDVPDGEDADAPFARWP